MDHILNSLQNNIILSNELVIDIRQDIRRHYPSADSSYRAKLLANALHKILDDYLSMFPDYEKRRIRIAIFNNTILANNLNVTKRDLLHEITNTICQHEEMTPYLIDWFNIHVDEQISDDELSAVIHALNPDIPFLIQPDLDVENKTESYIEILREKLILPNFHNFKVNLIQKWTDNLKTFYLLKNKLLVKAACALLLVIPIYFLSEFLLSPPPVANTISFVTANNILLFESQISNHVYTSVHSVVHKDPPGYPDFLMYSEVNYAKVIEYLNSRNSMMTNENYLKIIDEVAKEYNVHPVLLLAIIGQEQGFIPKDNPYAQKILNNPFNVYTSWTNYNTNLRDSCQVAAGTVIVILDNRPSGENPFTWLNTRYAEDPNWWKGVQELFYTLMTYAEK